MNYDWVKMEFNKSHLDNILLAYPNANKYVQILNLECDGKVNYYIINIHPVFLNKIIMPVIWEELEKELEQQSRDRQTTLIKYYSKKEGGSDKTKVKITDIAKKYGFEVKKNKMVCPFHDDHTPSLSLNDELGSFNCFGCGVHGGLVKFIALLEKVGAKENG